MLVVRNSVLLMAPYDPLGGEYTFVAPPLGVWRLAGVLMANGLRTPVFDPNCCEGPPEEALKPVQGSDSFTWPFQIGQRVRSKNGEHWGAVIDAWAEGDMPEAEAPNVVEAETFYRVRTEDGREFIA
jgi:hypothetical protein